MEEHRYTHVKRSLKSTPSRRDVVRGLAAATLGLGNLRLSNGVMARNKKRTGKKKNRKHDPPLVFNKYGCLDVGQPCKGNSALCCSGVCAGKKPKSGEKDQRVCAAHHARFCDALLDSCAIGANIICAPNSVCALTTGNAGFCANVAGVIDTAQVCRVCARDTDCEAEFGTGAACIVFGANCSTYCPATGGTACLPTAV